MNLQRCLCRKILRLNKNYKVSQYNSRLYESTQPSLTENKYDFEDIKIQNDRVERRKPPIPPFMKDIFVSVYNRDLLAYPEILNKEETQELDGRITTLENIMGSSCSIDDDIKSSNIYGAPLQITQGGLAMNATERLRYLEVLSSYNWQLANTISDHWIGVKALMDGLNVQKFNEMSPELISGDVPVHMCTREPVSEDVNSPGVRTTARQHDETTWYIQGEKYFEQSPASVKGYLLPLCVVHQNRMSAMLVDSAEVTQAGDRVKFMDAPGTQLDLDETKLMNIIGLKRLDISAITYSVVKNMMRDIVKQVRGKYIAGEPVSGHVLNQTYMGEALKYCYTCESMAYFTAGIIDGYQNPDYHVEAALCRVYATQYACSVADTLLRVIGVDSIRDTRWTEYLDTIRRLSLYSDYNDVLHTYIALSGLKHAGNIMSNEVKQLRNPMLYPTFIIRRAFQTRKQEADNPGLTLYLEEHLHPSLKQASGYLEYSVMRMKYAAELLLTRHGLQVAGAHNDLKRLSEAAMEIYAMTSVISRASRSYCIGVRNSDVEMKLAATIVDEKHNIVRKLIKQIDDGEYINLDHFNIEFGKKVFNTGTLLVEKPTERVFW